MRKTSYVIALGSNRPHGRHGAPAAVVAAAVRAIEATGASVLAVAPILTTPPLGPAGRAFANSAILIESAEDPAGLLRQLKAIERQFGRRSGKRWGPRVLDLDIILWSDGTWASPGLVVPHPEFRKRRFVLDPLVSIVPDWRDPLTGRKILHLHRSIQRRNPVDRDGRCA